MKREDTIATRSDYLNNNHLDRLIQREREKYRLRSVNFFNYLEERSKIGFTPTQFQIYRDNFFYRTFTTIPSISRVVAAAALSEDAETLADAGKNLSDETGLGEPVKVHSVLLRESHNTHSEKVFDLPGIKLRDSVTSPFLLQQALAFRKTQASLYNSCIYPVVLAAAYAQETAADPMLAKFYETLFAPYRAYYTPHEFDTVAEYFLVHITGVEQRHSDDAKRALFRSCRNEEDAQAALQSLTAFWEAQSNLWIAIYREMQRHQSELEIVPTDLREEV